MVAFFYAITWIEDDKSIFLILCYWQTASQSLAVTAL